MLTSTLNKQYIAAQLESEEIISKGIAFIKQHKKMLLALAVAIIALMAFFAPESAMAQTIGAPAGGGVNNPFQTGARSFLQSFRQFSTAAIVIILMACGFAVMRGSLGMNTFLYIAVGGILIMNAGSVVNFISSFGGNTDRDITRTE